MMEKSNTKRQILEVALELFSVKGFEATSVGDIAEEVGIRKASVYSHYLNKQQILDVLVEEILGEYKKYSVYERPEILEDLCNDFSVEKLVAVHRKQITYVVTDPYVSRIRHLMILE